MISDNIWELQPTDEELEDSIIYTTYRNDIYLFLNREPDLSPGSIAKEGSTQTYLDYVKAIKDQTVIDPSQPLFHVRPLSPDLHIIIHDYLYPDSSTFSSVQEAHADQDRSMMVDFQFTNEYPPQIFRTVNEQDWDWAVEDIESPRPLETSLQSQDEEVSSDVEFTSQKNKEWCDADSSTYSILSFEVVFFPEPKEYSFDSKLSEACASSSIFFCFSRRSNWCAFRSERVGGSIYIQGYLYFLQL